MAKKSFSPSDRAFTLLPKIKKGERAPVYAVSGPEVFKAELFVRQVREQVFDGEADILDGTQVEGAEVVEALATMSLFGPANADGKLVIVRKAESLKATDELLDHLQRALKASKEGDADPSLLLLVCDSIDNRKKLFQFLKKADLIFEMQSARGPDVASWVKYLAQEEDIELSAEAAALLGVVAEDSLARVYQEVRKLAAYKGDDKTAVSRADVEAVLSGGIRFEMAELVKSVIEGRRARSLLMVPNIINGSEEALGFVGFMTWGIKNPDRFRWQEAPTAVRMRQLVDRLLDLDLRLKTSTSAGGLTPAALVESFIIEVT